MARRQHATTLTIEVEVHNTSGNQYHSYDLQKYTEMARQFERLVEARFLHDGLRHRVLTNPGPGWQWCLDKHVAGSSFYHKLGDCEQKLCYPRPGAFEVVVRFPEDFGPIWLPRPFKVWSKLQTRRWPNLEVLVDDLACFTVACWQGGTDATKCLKRLTDAWSCHDEAATKPKHNAVTKTKPVASIADNHAAGSIALQLRRSRPTSAPALRSPPKATAPTWKLQPPGVSPTLLRLERSPLQNSPYVMQGDGLFNGDFKGAKPRLGQRRGQRRELCEAQRGEPDRPAPASNSHRFSDTGLVEKDAVNALRIALHGAERSSTLRPSEVRAAHFLLDKVSKSLVETAKVGPTAVAQLDATIAHPDGGTVAPSQSQSAVANGDGESKAHEASAEMATVSRVLQMTPSSSSASASASCQGDARKVSFATWEAKQTAVIWSIASAHGNVAAGVSDILPKEDRPTEKEREAIATGGGAIAEEEHEKRSTLDWHHIATEKEDTESQTTQRSAVCSPSQEHPGCGTDHDHESPKIQDHKLELEVSKRPDFQRSSHSHEQLGEVQQIDPARSAATPEEQSDKARLDEMTESTSSDAGLSISANQHPLAASAQNSKTESQQEDHGSTTCGALDSPAHAVQSGRAGETNVEEALCSSSCEDPRSPAQNPGPSIKETSPERAEVSKSPSEAASQDVSETEGAVSQEVQRQEMPQCCVGSEDDSRSPWAGWVSSLAQRAVEVNCQLDERERNRQFAEGSSQSSGRGSEQDAGSGEPFEAESSNTSGGPQRGGSPTASGEPFQAGLSKAIGGPLRGGSPAAGSDEASGAPDGFSEVAAAAAASDGSSEVAAAAPAASDGFSEVAAAPAASDGFSEVAADPAASDGFAEVVAAAPAASDGFSKVAAAAAASDGFSEVAAAPAASEGFSEVAAAAAASDGFSEGASAYDNDDDFIQADGGSSGASDCFSEVAAAPVAAASEARARRPESARPVTLSPTSVAPAARQATISEDGTSDDDMNSQDSITQLIADGRTRAAKAAQQATISEDGSSEEVNSQDSITQLIADGRGQYL